MLSQNGWPVATAAQVHYYPIPGDHSANAGTVAVRKGTVATVLVSLMGDLQKIQPAKWPGMWGWYVRPIRGQSTGYSNHASGTAIDWRAPDHPRQSGSRYLGWTAAQVMAIHGLLGGKYRRVIRWGADYSSTPFDPMHFEINTDDVAVAALAAALTKPPAPVVNHSSVYFNPVMEAEMFLVREKSSPAVWLVWPGYRTWIQSSLLRDLYEKKLGIGVEDIPDNTIQTFGILVGPDHA